MAGKKGKIILVGSGPGDPDLITVKGLQAIQEAEILVYDYLVPGELLSYASKDCEKIYVGKKVGCHIMPQKEINCLIVERAREGRLVVRLKGGDPFVFGRGGEEALAAKEAGVEFEIIPGVTAGVAVPAYAGIPVTHRGITTSVTFITGHEDPGKDESEIDWASLGSLSGTLVFYMGVGRLCKIAENLITHGRAPATPVAVIHRGTTEYQKTVVGTLENIENKVTEAGFKPPALIVVGEVVLLREKLNWYETRPLFGRTVVVTRSREQASEFSRLLRKQGARVIELPTIRIAPGPDPGLVQEALRQLADYDWIVFTSANGVKFFLEALRSEGLDVRAMGKAGLCAIGPATAAALESSGLKVDLVPETYVAESVIEALSSQEDLSGKKVLIPRAEIARKVLPERLHALGAQVDEVALYSTRIDEPENSGKVRQQLIAGEIDLVTFTSSSTVENFVALVGGKEVGAAAGRTLFASIGPITAARAEDYGLKSAIVPETYTIVALCEAICDYFAQGRA